jgi:hypothetical protein
MDAEAFGAAADGLTVGIDDLVVGDTVLGLDRVADDGVPGATRAGVVTKQTSSGNSGTWAPG